MSKNKLEILEWIIIKCAYCKEDTTMRDFHWQYQFGITHSDGTKENGKLQCICPKCDKTNVITEIKLNKEK